MPAPRPERRRMKVASIQSAAKHRQVRPGEGHGAKPAVPGGGWLAPGCTPPSSAVASLIHDQFRALVLHPSFSCLGAKSAIRTGGYQMGIYDELGSAGTTCDL